MNMERMEELRVQLVAETKRKQKATEDMDTADSMRTKAEEDYGAASDALRQIRGEIMAHILGEQA